MKIKFFILFLVLVLVFSLVSCKNKSRIDELENKIVELQEELSQKESKIKELEDTTTTTIVESTPETTSPETENEIIEEVINNYINAVEKEDFDKQREYVIKYALDLVNFKEIETRKDTSTKEREFFKQPVSNIKINGNEAEAFMSFTEHLIGYDNSEYDLITEGKILLEKINNEWKIKDYTRKNRLISEAYYRFENLTVEKDNVIIAIDSVLYSIFDKYVIVNLSISNNTDKNLRYYSSDAILIGPDKNQIKSLYYDENLENILSEATASGEIQFNWNYDSNNNFYIFTGNIIDDNGYDYIKGIQIEINLNQAIRY